MTAITADATMGEMRYEGILRKLKALSDLKAEQEETKYQKG